MSKFVGGWFEEYSVAYCCRLLCVGLRNILLCVGVFVVGWFVVDGCVVNVDKDRRGGWMEGDGKGLGCIRINLILPI